MKHCHQELLKLLSPSISTPPIVKDIDALIAIANEERVIFSLAKKLVVDHNASIPEQAKHYLTDLWESQSYRQKQCLVQLYELTKLFNQAGLTPLYFKGAAALLQGWYGDGTERFFIDVDILFSPSESKKAYALLLNYGYKKTSTQTQREHHHHLPSLYHEERPLTVELHHQPLPARAGYFLMADELFLQAVSFDIDGKYLLPSLEHSLALVVASNEFGLYGLRCGRVHARYALDALMLWLKIDSNTLDGLTDNQRNIVISFCSIAFELLEQKTFFKLSVDESRIQLYKKYITKHTSWHMFYYKFIRHFAPAYLKRRYRFYTRNKWFYFCLKEAYCMIANVLKRQLKMFLPTVLCDTKNK